MEHFEGSDETILFQLQGYWGILTGIRCSLPGDLVPYVTMPEPVSDHSFQ